MSESPILVLKADGSREVFNSAKLRASLQNSGATEATAEEITEHIRKELVSGMSTSEIYAHAFAVLHSRAQERVAARYSLRRSILELGPTGYPFEKFIGEVYRRKGYGVAIDQTVQGKCVEHEVDVIAWNARELLFMEAKYHHELAYKSDVKIALYVKARFDDLRVGNYRFGSHTKLAEGLLVTNTKFTDRAIQYAECSKGVRLLGWNYPVGMNLHDLIEETGLHPVTSLTSLSVNQKKALMDKGVVLCESIRDSENTLHELGFDRELMAKVIAEANTFCPIS